MLGEMPSREMSLTRRLLRHGRTVMVSPSTRSWARRAYGIAALGLAAACASQGGYAGDYCRRDPQCEEGLVCIDLTCIDPFAERRAIDGGIVWPDAARDAGPLDAFTAELDGSEDFAIGIDGGDGGAPDDLSSSSDTDASMDMSAGDMETLDLPHRDMERPDMERPDMPHRDMERPDMQRRDMERRDMERGARGDMDAMTSAWRGTWALQMAAVTRA